MSHDELVDIVDTKGKFIEVMEKREAHKLGLLHRVVIAIVIDSRGRWLLVKQSKGKQDAGQYVAPAGGHVSAGETDIVALKREIQEELGFTEDFKYEFVSEGIFNRFTLGRQENHLFAIYKVYSDAKPILSREAESYKYFTLEELKRELKENPQIFGDAFHFGMKFVPL